MTTNREQVALHTQGSNTDRSARATVIAWVTVGLTCAILIHQAVEASEDLGWYAAVFLEDIWLAVIGVVPVLLVRLRRPQGYWSDVWLTAVYSAVAAGVIGGTATLVLSYADVGPDAPRTPFLVDAKYFLLFFGESYIAGLLLGGLAAVARRRMARVHLGWGR